MSTDSQAETGTKTRLAAVVPPADARSVLISVNPRAGARSRHDRVREIEEVLRAAGYEVRSTTVLDELRELSAAAWNERRLRTVISVGGDGTASLVRSYVPLEVPLLPLPLGTENLLARHLRQSADPGEVRRTLDDGVMIDLDMGRAGGRYFLLMVSVGFDAEVVRSLHVNRSGNITRLSYYLPALRTIRGYGYPEIQLYCRDIVASGGEGAIACAAAHGAEPLRCRWLFGFNLPLYALGIPIAPEANGTDGRLDLVAFERGGIGSVARYLWHVMRRSHDALADSTLFRSGRFRLESDGASDVAYQLDGDFAGTLPVDIEVLPGQLRLFVSREAAERLGFEVTSA